ncbi:MAG: 4-hydroxy-tetrahydrodipicolinate reductase [Acidobacteria bacterium]|nr:4-hydroxy-tetrahydrodipicolinate reductase [Acidobacteriota bacterium]
MSGLALALVGYGKMGRVLENAAVERGHRVVARIDPAAPQATARAVEPAALAGAEVALEFTAPAAAAANVLALLAAGVPVVSGTTGWTDRLDEARRLAADRGVGLLWAPNFSLGMHVLLQLVERAAATLGGGGYAPYLVEEHHQQKADAPSGTARRIGELLVALTPGKSRFGPAPGDGPVPPELVPAAWVRAGQIPGTHRVGWDGPGETLEIVHRVRDRAVFAHGALLAAEWLRGRRGPHTLEEMLAELEHGERRNP